MNEVYGDLIKMAKNDEFDVIVHGCNCFKTMGSGIAAQIKKEFPDAWEADANTKMRDRNKLGTYTFAEVGNLTIINAYTQYHWITEDESTITEENPRGIAVDYDAIKLVFKKIAAKYNGKRIGIPLIGAGLAGGNWDIIAEIISEAMPDTQLTLVRYKS